MTSVLLSWNLHCYVSVVHQLTSGEVWVQFNDGSQLVVQEGVSCITYASSPDGRITRWETRRRCEKPDWAFKQLPHRLALPPPLPRRGRYQKNEKLPEIVKEKLHCLSTILGLLANSSAHHLRHWRRASLRCPWKAESLCVHVLSCVFVNISSVGFLHVHKTIIMKI